MNGVSGTTNVVDPDQLAKSAAGGGLAEGSKTLHDLYLDLAKQASPVIEVGAAVPVVVSEGKELASRILVTRRCDRFDRITSQVT